MIKSLEKKKQLDSEGIARLQAANQGKAMTKEEEHRAAIAAVAAMHRSKSGEHEPRSTEVVRVHDTAALESMNPPKVPAGYPGDRPASATLRKPDIRAMPGEATLEFFHKTGELENTALPAPSRSSSRSGSRPTTAGHSRSGSRPTTAGASRPPVAPGSRPTTAGRQRSSIGSQPTTAKSRMSIGSRPGTAQRERDEETTLRTAELRARLDAISAAEVIRVPSHFDSTSVQVTEISSLIR